MITSRFNHHFTSAKVNGGVLAVVLFSLVLCGLTGLIMPGGKDPIAGDEAAPEDRQTVPQSLVIDDISSEETGDVQEDQEILKVRIESSRTGENTGENAGSVDELLDPESMVRGRVFVDGQGKQGILVLANRHKLRKGQKYAFTIEGGFYEIKGLAAGKHGISATTNEDGIADRMVSRTIEEYVQTSDGGIVECDLFFEQGASITGTVYAFGKPKGGVSVTAWRSNKDGQEKAQSTSGQDGTYMLSGLSPGLYKLSAYLSDHEGYYKSYRHTRDVIVQLSVTVIDFDLIERESGEVFGYVYENNHPTPDIRVFLHSDRIDANIATDESGAYRFNKVPTGKILLTAHMRKGYPRVNFVGSKNLELIKGDSIRQDLHLFKQDRWELAER